MKTAVLVWSIVLTLPAAAQTPKTPPPNAPVLTGSGNIQHPVSTRSAEAQRFFDQGLNLAYGFNHDEAFRAFERAAQLDPQLAMAVWGQALVLGPNINLPVDEERARRAYELTQKAKAMAGKAPANEQAYIEALTHRYAADPKAERGPLDRAYAGAMRELSKRYPDDLDAATLFAEACMDINPWAYWKDGKPAEGTEEIVATLQSVLRRDPDHIGAAHLMIHAVEASGQPELSAGAARVLAAAAPAAGHLVHMPSHLYSLLGDHDASVAANEKAALIDRAYVTRHKISGFYPMLYYTHNMHFAAFAHTQRGDYRSAMRWARDVYDHTAPMVKDVPLVEAFTPTPILVQTRFRRWNELMRVQEPAPGMPITRALWHFGRGMAAASGGRASEAERELAAMAKEKESVPKDALFGFSNAHDVLSLAAHMLEGRTAEARGAPAKAIEHLAKAIEVEDKLPYDEPPDWYLHARESLGGLHLRHGRAVEAEKAFRADLVKHPRNGRSLFGLMEALKAQGRSDEARLVEREYREAWRNADTRLAVTDL